MDSFIVRIYRRLRDENSMVGVVKTTGSNAHENSFHSASELWDILLAMPSGNKTPSDTVAEKKTQDADN